MPFGLGVLRTIRYTQKGTPYFMPFGLGVLRTIRYNNDNEDIQEGEI